MKYNVEKTSENMRLVRVEIPVERIAEEFEKMYSEIGQKAMIPGFRKGKIPRSVIKMRMGEDISSQIGIDLIKESLPEAMKAIEEQTIGYPEFNEWKVEEGQAFVYEARIEVLPPFELKDYKGINVPKHKLEVSDADLAQGLERIRAGQTTFEVVTGRPAQKGDRVYGRISLTMDGAPMPGWTNRHIEVDIGKNTFFPDSSMEEKMVEAEVEKDHTYAVEFPADYSYYRDVAGKRIEVLLKINDIKAKKVPEINDELAKDLGLENVDELKTMVRQDFESQRKREIDEAFDSALMDLIEKANPIPAPQPMIESEAEFIVDNYFKSQKELTGEYKEKLIESMKPMAEKRVRHRLILQRVAELENIDVTEEEVNKAFEEMAEQENKDPESIRSEWEKDGLIDNLKRQLKRSKAMTWLKENAVPVDAPEPETGIAGEGSSGTETSESGGTVGSDESAGA